MEQQLEQIFPYPVSNTIYNFYIEYSSPLWKSAHQTKFNATLHHISNSTYYAYENGWTMVIWEKDFTDGTSIYRWIGNSNLQM